MSKIAVTVHQQKTLKTWRTKCTSAAPVHRRQCAAVAAAYSRAQTAKFSCSNFY